MVGIYHIALLADADASEFASQMAGAEGALQLTRVTSGFDCQLLERSVLPGGLRRYAWHVTAQLVSGGYDFEQNVERLGSAIENFGGVIGVETYTVTAEQ